MLTHAEAQALISARLDGPLDPIAERELEAHLVSCASCRAFNDSSVQLMQGLRSMPYLPASPAVKRAVIDHVKTSRRPWNIVAGPWISRAVPVAATIAATLLLTLLGAFAFQRFNDRQNPIEAVTSFLSQPASESETETPDRNATFQTVEESTGAQPTQAVQSTESVSTVSTGASDSGVGGQSGQGIAVPELTPTVVLGPTGTPPSEPTATVLPEPTATDVQEPTATATTEPTSTLEPTVMPTSEPTPEPTLTPVPPTATPSPEPTATPTPEPTATAEPTATQTPDPTATAEPTATPTQEPEPTATAEPTATPTQEPTATQTPDPTPTQEPEPTATAEPTATPTQEPTATQTPEPTATTQASNDRGVPPIAGPEVGSGDDQATPQDQPARVERTPEPSATVPPEPTATDVPDPTVTPTPEPTATSTPEPTATPEPTPTLIPPTATPTPEPTATLTPEPTSTPTPEPTSTPEPTPEPTATATPTPEPTATPTPEPTSTPTPEPTQEPTATPTPEPTPTELPTEEPTEAPNEQIILPVDGTVVDATEEATQEEVDPTTGSLDLNDITPIASEEDEDEGVILPVDDQTPVDTTENDDAPAANTPEAEIDPGDETVPNDGSPDAGSDSSGDGSSDESSGAGNDDPSGVEGGVIEPVDGAGAGVAEDTTSDPTEESGTSDQATESPDATDGPGEGDGGVGVIEPVDGTDATQDVAGDPTEASGDAEQVIEPTDENSNGEDDNSGSGSGNDGEAGGGNAPDGSSGRGANSGEEEISETSQGLGSAQEVASVAEVPGDPGTRLGADGNSIGFDVNPGRVSLESNGITLQTDQTESGQAVFACDGSGSCTDVSSASADGSHSDYPLGWIGSNIIYERIDENGDVSFRAVQIDSDSLEVFDDSELGSGSETLVRPYPLDGGLLVPTSDTWLFITADGVSQIDDNPFGNDINLIRFKPSNGTIAYVAGGEIIVAPLGSPGSPIAQVPFTGTDFDLSPDGSQIVVIDGSGIRILDLDGNVVQEFPNDEGISIGGIAWMEGRGIIYVDETNGVIRSIQP